MNPLLKGGLVLGAVSGTAGAGYIAYNAMQPTPTVTAEKQKTTTYAEALKDTLLPTSGGDHDANWKARLTSLQKVEPVTNLIESLRGLKAVSVDDKWQQLRTWCADNINNPSKGNQDKEFQSIQSYCTYSIKEKLGGKAIAEDDHADGRWKAAHGKLANIDNSKLSEQLVTAKSEGAEAGKVKVKAWCDPIYSSPYKGEKDSDFELAKQICVF